MIKQAQILLKSVFGYDSFISLQQDVIANVLHRRDTLAVMPTGGGKSVCYQIPALLFEGLTIVVSPLISLMKDQVEQLAQLDVPAVLLNSTLSPQAYRSNVDRLKRGEVKLLYMAPETLLKPQMLDLLESLSISCLAIDEAHCISEWGPDFRPEYRQLAEVRSRLPRAVCIALTATATPRVRQDIKKCLGFDDSSEFTAGFNRENLFLRVIPKTDPLRQAIQFLKRFPSDPGIIYCLTRKGVDGLCAALQAEGFSASPYHAGLPEAERSRNQERFVRDEVRIIVATVAFGMGIDKSNVRFVLHRDLPRSIEGYYQEIGRAGRDGMRAECLLLYSPADAQKVKYFIDQKEGQERRTASLQLNAMMHFAESDVCRRIPLLGYFGEAFPHENCGMCDNCLAGERVMQDVTIPAQKFLSCVKRTGERFGIAHTIDVLMGSKASRVLKFEHDKLSTYGIGRELSRKQWQQLARQFLHKGFMVQDDEFGGLSLTPKAWEVFRGQEAVFGRLDDVPEPETERAPGKAAAGGETPCDPELFEDLRRKRKELAQSANVPPYVIFSDRTLAEMAARLPQSDEEMLEISGVGLIKLERHGSLFMEIIKNYCREHPEEEAAAAARKSSGPGEPPRSGGPNRSGEASGPKPERSKEGAGKRHIAVGEAFNAGRSVESLVRELGIRQTTVLDHLFRFHQEGYSLRPNGLLPLITLPEDDLARVMDAFREFGPQYMRPVFEALNGEIGYEDLRIIRLYWLSLQNPVQ